MEHLGLYALACASPAPVATFLGRCDWCRAELARARAEGEDVEACWRRIAAECTRDQMARICRRR